MPDKATLPLASQHAARALVVAAILGACAGSRVEEVVKLAATDRAEVVYVDPNNRLVLRTTTHVSSDAYREHGIYGSAGTEPDVKFTDTARVEGLINSLYAVGLAEHAGTAAAPGAGAWIEVRHGDQTLVWSRPRFDVASEADLARFDSARHEFLSIYNTIMSFHSGSVSADELSRAADAQQRRNADAVRSIQRKAHGQGQ